MRNVVDSFLTDEELLLYTWLQNNNKETTDHILTRHFFTGDVRCPERQNSTKMPAGTQWW